MELTWLGHSAVSIQGSKFIIIDPFLTGNPAASATPESFTQADAVVVTHDHGDHMGDALDIAKRTGAVLFGIHEIAVMAADEGIESEGMNIGGSVERNGMTVHMVQALHSCDKGDPAGVVIELDEKTIYHAGDTGLTYDMKLIGDFFHPDLSFLPIGDRYTMGPASAAKAVEFTQTKKVIPIHFGTFPIVNADPEDFKRRVGSTAEVIILKPGETYIL